MTTLLEAAKQALEALEKSSAQLTRLGYSANHADKAIPAIRQAIAQAEQQEPVAWLWFSEHGSERLEWEQVEDTSKWKSTPLYTAPPQREWVEPSEEQLYALSDDFDWACGNGIGFAYVVLKLAKELNHG